MFSMLGFVNKYLEPNGYMDLFYEDSPQVAKNITCHSWRTTSKFSSVGQLTIAYNVQT
jgi:hypothetical protein